MARATPALNGFLYPRLLSVTLLKLFIFNFIFFFPPLHLEEGVGLGRGGQAVAVVIPGVNLHRGLGGKRTFWGGF